MTAREIIDHELEAVDLERCGDHSCIFGRPSGMGTYGGCHHLKVSMAAKLTMQRMANVIRSLAEKLDAVREVRKVEARTEAEYRADWPEYVLIRGPRSYLVVDRDVQRHGYLDATDCRSLARAMLSYADEIDAAKKEQTP